MLGPSRIKALLVLTLIICLILNWNTATAQEDSRTPHDTPPNTITSIDWSPDGLLLATANNNGAIQIRDAASRTIIHDLITAQPNPVLTVAWSPDGTAIAATVNENVYIWERDTWQVLHILQGHVEPVWSVAWSPDGTMLAGVNQARNPDPNFLIWDTSTGQQIQAMETQGGFYKIAWSPDNSSLAATIGNGVALWDVAQTSIQGGLQNFGEVVDAKWSPDGSKIVVVGETNIVSIWDVASQQVIQELEGHQIGIPDMVFAVEWSPDGSMVASAATDGTVRVWDAATGQSLHVINVGSEVYSVTWSPDGDSLAYGGESAVVKTFQLGNTPTPTPSDSRTPHDTPPNTITSIDWSPDGLLLATANNNGAIQIRDAASGTIVHNLITAQPNPVLTVAWSPDGTAIAATVNENVYIWQRDTWQVLHILQGHLEPVWSVAWSPDGTKLASVTNTSSTNLNFFIWDASTGQQIQAMEALSGFYKVAWSPDNRSLAATIGSGVALWDVSQISIQGGLHSVGEVVDAKWSPDGSRIVVVGETNIVSIWDVASQQVIQELDGHQIGIPDMVFDVEWSPDGSMIASAATDGTVRVWDAATGQAVHVINVGSEVYSVTWSPDGDSLAYGGEGAVVQTVQFATTPTPTPSDSRAPHDTPANTITSIDWNIDGTLLAISYDSGDLDVQDVNTSQVIYEDNYGNIAEISWSPTNNLLAIAMRVGFVEIVDIDTGTQLMQIDQGFTVNSLAWHPDGNQFAVVSATGAGSGADYWIRVWDVTTQQLVSESRQFLVTSTDWSPDGQNLVVGSHEARTVVVNAATGAAILELSDTGTRTVAWNPDSRVNRFATTGDMGEVRVWDGRDGQMLWEVKTGRYASQFDWNYAGTQLAGASGSLLYLWDGETGNEITQFTADPALIDTVSWSPDDSKIAYGTTDGQVIILYLPIANVGPDQTVFTTSGQAPVTLDRSGSTDPDGTIASYEWSENGNVIATGAAPQVTLSVGTHTLTLKVTDNDGLVTTDDVVITVESGTAPTATSVTPTACNFTVSAGDLAGLIAAINTANGASSPTNICLADSSTYLVMPSGRTYSSPPS